MSYDCRTNVKKIVAAPRIATTVLNMFKTIVAIPDLCRSSTVRPESWRRRHERVTDVSRFITILKSWTIGTKDRDSVTEALAYENCDFNLKITSCDLPVNR